MLGAYTNYDKSCKFVKSTFFFVWFYLPSSLSCIHDLIYRTKYCGLSHGKILLFLCCSGSIWVAGKWPGWCWQRSDSMAGSCLAPSLVQHLLGSLQRSRVYESGDGGLTVSIWRWHSLQWTCKNTFEFICWIHSFPPPPPFFLTVLLHSILFQLPN